MLFSGFRLLEIRSSQDYNIQLIIPFYHGTYHRPSVLLCDVDHLSDLDLITVYSLVANYIFVIFVGSVLKQT